MGSQRVLRVLESIEESQENTRANSLYPSQVEPSTQIHRAQSEYAG